MDVYASVIMVLGFFSVLGIAEFSYMFFFGDRNAVINAKKFKLRFSLLIDDAPAKQATWVKRGAYAADPVMDAKLKRYAFLENLYLLIENSGKKVTVAKVLVVMASMTVTVFLLMAVLHHFVSGLVAAPVFGYLPVLWLKRAKKKRLAKIEGQLPDALDLLSQSMRAGHAFTNAFRVVGQQSPEPIAQEFRITSDEINFGSSVRDGIMGLAQRVELMDMRYFVLTILIQMDTGGSLSGLLQDLSKLMRERQKLRKQIRVLSAEGRVSAVVLCGLPIAFAGIMSFISPGYLKFFWTVDVGISLAKLSGFLFVLGILWMRKIIAIKV